MCTSSSCSVWAIITTRPRKRPSVMKRCSPYAKRSSSKAFRRRFLIARFLVMVDSRDLAFAAVDISCPSTYLAAVLPTRSRASCPAFDFHPRRISAVNRTGSLSTNFAQCWQSQRPLVIAVRCSWVNAWSYRGPPGAAAVMWAATPTFTACEASSWGPLVGRGNQASNNRNSPVKRGHASLYLESRLEKKDSLSGPLRPHARGEPPLTAGARSERML